MTGVKILPVEYLFGYVCLWYDVESGFRSHGRMKDEERTLGISWMAKSGKNMSPFDMEKKAGASRWQVKGLNPLNTVR